MALSFHYFLHLLNDPILLIKTVGYVGLILIIFSETGLLIGLFLPGDSLLINAGILAASGILSLKFLIITLTISAIAGDAVGFYIGQKLGNKLYSRKNSFFFRRQHLEYAHNFYEKYGRKTIIYARFVPIARTFAPTIAGAAGMNYFKFAIYNIVGGIGWVLSTTLAGYYLGKSFGDKIQHYIHYLIIGVVLVSVLPLIWEWFKARKRNKNAP